MHPRRFGILGVGLVLGGCVSVQTTVTTTGPKQPSRGEHCDFQILTATPVNGFVEIGTIDISGTLYSEGNKLARVKEIIERDVCQAGGDAAVAMPNGYGYYIKATILKSTGVAVAATAPTTAEGCRAIAFA